MYLKMNPEEVFTLNEKAKEALNRYKVPVVLEKVYLYSMYAGILCTLLFFIDFDDIRNSSLLTGFALSSLIRLGLVFQLAYAVFRLSQFKEYYFRYLMRTTALKGLFSVFIRYVCVIAMGYFVEKSAFTFVCYMP